MPRHLRETFHCTWTLTSVRRMGYRLLGGSASLVPYTFRLPTGFRATLRRVHPYEGLLPLLLHRGRSLTRAASTEVDVQRAGMTQVYLHLGE